MLSRRHFPAPGRVARGAAALTIVMILFFIMALVAAYTSRNLIFEQRISANSYRATRAAVAADAAVDWTLAMLNGGRIDDNCQPVANAGNTDFRRRYWIDATDQGNGEGGYQRLWTNPPPGLLNPQPVFPACIQLDGQLSCVCPQVGGVNPAMAVPADGVGSTFRISFVQPVGVVWPGTLHFISRGCDNPGVGDTACFSANRNNLPINADAMASTLVTVGLLRALPVAPVAALTAGQNIVANAGVLRVGNGDADSGLTAHAGGVIDAPGTDHRFVGPAGSTSDGRLAGDAQLLNLAGQPNELWFRTLFGMNAATFSRQPAVVTVNCANGCLQAQIQNQVTQFPRNPIWVQGNLTLDATTALGNAADPLMLIVTGTLTLGAATPIVGFVHAANINWGAGAQAASLQGAMVAATNFTATTTATISYDRAVLDTIRLRYGSFVRVPGGWNVIAPQ